MEPLTSTSGSEHPTVLRMSIRLGGTGGSPTSGRQPQNTGGQATSATRSLHRPHRFVLRCRSVWVALARLPALQRSPTSEHWWASHQCHPDFSIEHIGAAIATAPDGIEPGGDGAQRDQGRDGQQERGGRTPHDLIGAGRGREGDQGQQREHQGRRRRPAEDRSSASASRAARRGQEQERRGERRRDEPGDPGERPERPPGRPLGGSDRRSRRPRRDASSPENPAARNFQARPEPPPRRDISRSRSIPIQEDCQIRKLQKDRTQRNQE